MSCYGSPIRKLANESALCPGSCAMNNVHVGRHIPVSPGALPRLLKRFEEVYSRLGKADSIIAAAAAHHRLLWIHPFLDGNGSVARLMSHGMLLDALDTRSVWSVVRGLGHVLGDRRLRDLDPEL
jgi:Fic family protein